MESFHTRREPKPITTEESQAILPIALGSIHRNFPEGKDPAVDLVVEGMTARITKGFEDYGQDLSTNDGRNNKVDLWQEVVDMCNYAFKELIESADEDGVVPQDVDDVVGTLIAAAFVYADYLISKKVS